MRWSVPRIDASQGDARRSARLTRIECNPISGVKVKEEISPTSMALAIGALVALAIGGCGHKLGELMYNDSLLCGDQNQACAPDAGEFRLLIVNRTQLEVANPSIPTFDMVAKPGTTRVGFAYVLLSPRQDSGVVQMFPDAGIVDYDIMFQEFDVDAGVGSGAQRVQTVQRFFGVSVAYQANGDPAVAYLGGPPDFTETFWFQNDAAISFRSGGTWTERVAATDSSPPVSGSAPSDNGKIVGFYPALIFEGNSAVSEGPQCPLRPSAGTGDWNSANLDGRRRAHRLDAGGATSTGNSKRARWTQPDHPRGRDPQLRPAGRGGGLGSRAPSGPDTFGQDIEFSEQQADGSWKSCGALQPLTNVDTPSILGANGASLLPQHPVRSVDRLPGQLRLRHRRHQPQRERRVLHLVRCEQRLHRARELGHPGPGVPARQRRVVRLGGHLARRRSLGRLLRLLQAAEPEREQLPLPTTTSRSPTAA